MKFEQLKTCISKLYCNGPMRSADLAEELGMSRLGSGGLTASLVKSRLVESNKKTKMLRLSRIATHLIDNMPIEVKE
jgi:DNA-binding transcriptional regulator LsrR (DeoR family)